MVKLENHESHVKAENWWTIHTVHPKPYVFRMLAKAFLFNLMVSFSCPDCLSHHVENTGQPF